MRATSIKGRLFVATTRTMGKVLSLFSRYLGKGYYPFYDPDHTGEYYGRIERLIDTSINQDIPSIKTTDVPFTLNVQSLSQKTQVSRNSIIKMFELLDKGGILR